MTVPLDTVNDIRSVDAAGRSRSEIARMLHVSRNTVAKYADMEDMSPAAPMPQRRGRPALEGSEEWVWIGYTDVDSSGRGARDGRAVYEGPQAPEAFHRRIQEADSRPLQRRKAQARDHGRVRPRQEHRGEAGQVDKRDRLAARRGQPHARAEPDPGARAREPQAPDGGRRLKTSGADIRSKVRAIAANEGRYPISAQCRLLGVARSTYYSMRSRADRPDAPDPAAPAVVAAHAASKGRSGSRKIKASPGRSGVTVSRRRVCRIMRENGLAGAYGRKRFKVHPGAINEADVSNVVARGFGGRAPYTHICSDLTYVRVGASWNYACLLVDPCNREIVGHSVGPRKDARLVKSAFATVSFPISDIEVFHTDRGSEFDNAEIDLMLETFGIERSLSAKGRPPRQRRRRVDQQDTEGRARPPRDVRHDARATGQALGLRALVQQLQDPLDAGPHVSGRVQGGGAVPPGIFQIGVPNPARDLVGIAVPAEEWPLTVQTDGGAVCMWRKWR